MRNASYRVATLEATAERVLTPVKTRLKEHMRIARQRTEASPADGASAVRDLLAHATPLVAIFDIFFGEAANGAKELLDETATICVECLVSYQKKMEDNHAFVDLLQMTLPLADALELRQRIEKNIQIGKHNLAFAELEPIRAMCEAAAKAAEANPASGDKEAQRILSATSHILPKLSSSGLPQETIDRARDEAALALMHCAVVFGNNTEKWKPCIAILEQSLRLAVGPDAKDRVTRNLPDGSEKQYTLWRPYPHLLSSLPKQDKRHRFCALRVYGSRSHNRFPPRHLLFRFPGDSHFPDLPVSSSPYRQGISVLRQSSASNIRQMASRHFRWPHHLAGNRPKLHKQHSERWFLRAVATRFCSSAQPLIR